MVVTRWRSVIAGALLMGAGFGSRTGAQTGPDGPPALEGPAPGTATPGVGTAEPGVGGALHEAFQTPGTRAGQVRVPKSPPPPITERPSADRPNPQSQWISGYWSWDPARTDFVWISGVWRVPPAGAIWIGGRWMRDVAGWYWLPGFWSQRQSRSAPAPAPAPAPSRTDWRTTGPPADQPDDTPGPAPGPDFFFVPGHYTPEADRMTWMPGFWARSQPGWDWVPARWVRRPDGWDFRAGYWARDPSVVNDGRPTDLTGRPPTPLESEPGTSRDPIAEAEATARATNPAMPAPVVVVPGGGLYPLTGPPIGYSYGVPMSVIRPPGLYPYGPNGVVVPATVPPFVQRLLNRVLP